jgi:hypothetical protein
MFGRLAMLPLRRFHLAAVSRRLVPTTIYVRWPMPPVTVTCAAHSLCAALAGAVELCPLLPLPLFSSEEPSVASTYTHSDHVRAYLFECEDDGLFAVSLEPSGSNIPERYCHEGWTLREEFELGMDEPMPIAVDPGPVIRGVREYGYYVWRQGRKH